MSADRHVVEPKPEDTLAFSIEALISRSSSLVDHRDGTNKEGVDYTVIPKIQTSFGSLKAVISYSQDLKNQSEQASTFNDISLSFALNPNKWQWSPPYILTLTPFSTIILPVSKTSVKRDQLQTAVSFGFSFGIIPDGVAPKKDGAWSLAIAVSGGQNVHAYETNINGAGLFKYRSNQSINLGYSYKYFSFSTEFINKSRWTYQGNTNNFFEHTEEIGYGISDHFSVALGHTNAGNAIKDNAVDSNLSVFSENDSMIYVSTGLAF